MKIKSFLYILLILIATISCNSDIKQVQSIGDSFYAYLQQGDILNALTYTYTPKFIRDTAKLRSLQKQYGKILSYNRLATTLLDDQKIFLNNDTLLADLAVLEYKIKYEKVSVNERLVLYKIKKTKSGYHDTKYRIYYYQSGYDKAIKN